MRLDLDSAHVLLEELLRRLPIRLRKEGFSAEKHLVILCARAGYRS